MPSAGLRRPGITKYDGKEDCEFPHRGARSLFLPKLIERRNIYE